jgi:uncharacterized repeat protein (TIGR03803 family)
VTFSPTSLGDASGTLHIYSNDVPRSPFDVDLKGTGDFPPPTGVLTVMRHFSGRADGALPETGLVLGQDGLLYGVAAQSGPRGGGTFFRLSIDGDFRVLHAFNIVDGAKINRLIVGSDGNFYGTSLAGGRSRYGGTVFRVSPAGAFASLRSFSGPDGLQPVALVQGSDGFLYGCAFAGALNRAPIPLGRATTKPGNGLIFRMDRAGRLFTVLHKFAGSDGAGPFSLLQNDDGYLYGSTNYGGAGYTGMYLTGYGNLFKLSHGGEFEVLPGNGAFFTKGQDGDFFGFAVTSLSGRDTIARINSTANDGSLPV